MLLQPIHSGPGPQTLPLGSTFSLQTLHSSQSMKLGCLQPLSPKPCWGSDPLEGCWKVILRVLKVPCMHQPGSLKSCSLPLRPHYLDPIQNHYSPGFQVFIKGYSETTCHLTVFLGVIYCLGQNTHAKSYLKNRSELALGIIFPWRKWFVSFSLMVRIFVEGKDEVECLWEKPRWLSTEILTELSVFEIWSDPVRSIRSAQTAKSQIPNVECHCLPCEVCFSCHL